MLRITILTLFPDALRAFCDASIVGRARRAGLLAIDLVDPREWTTDRHRTIDDRPYGGGPGMVLMAPPLARCLDDVLAERPGARLLLTSPQGRRLDQPLARELSDEREVVILCGHYEGIDERLIELYRPEEVSVGDVVLSGGESAALVIVDAVTRLLPGALGHDQSAHHDSFAGDHGLLDHPCYTRPPEFRGLRVPGVLLSGDHAAIERWRAEQRLQRTRERRPDLLEGGSSERDGPRPPGDD